MARDKARPMILATRFGFHGKKGLLNAVTGSETDAERDPRVKFIGFPMHECRDVANRDDAFDPAPYRKELDALYHQFGRKLGGRARLAGQRGLGDDAVELVVCKKAYASISSLSIDTMSSWRTAKLQRCLDCHCRTW